MNRLSQRRKSIKSRLFEYREMVFNRREFLESGGFGKSEEIYDMIANADSWTVDDLRIARGNDSEGDIED